MKITVLVENTAAREGILAEHGLSLYLETGDRRILFDAGQSGAFAENAKQLGIDLALVDTAVLSHGHSDHGGGLLQFRELNRHAEIYVNQFAFRPYYNAHGKSIGLDPVLKAAERLVLTSEPLSLGEGLTLYPAGETAPPDGTSGLQVLEQGQLTADDFCHEQYLLIEERGQRVLFSGCSHRGVVNIVERFRPDVLVGGFHVKDVALTPPGEAYLLELAEKLKAYPTRYYTCHCTGQDQFRVMKAVLGDRLSYLSGGNCLEI